MHLLLQMLPLRRFHLAVVAPLAASSRRSKAGGRRVELHVAEAQVPSSPRLLAGELAVWSRQPLPVGLTRRRRGPLSKKRKQKTRSFSSTAPEPIVNIADRRSKREALQAGRKVSIFLAILSLSGRVHYTHAMAFARAMASSMLEECPFQFGVHIEPGRRGADYARNCVVKTFLESTDADWLMMVDEDEVIPDNFWQLCTVRDADIVSGITPVWVGNMDPEAMLRVNNYGVNEEGQCYNLPTPGEEVQQPYRVPILGTGCIAIRRRVFAPKPHGLGLSPFYFTREEDGKVKAGEDINFSVDANRAGLSLAVHPQVIFDHTKEIPLLQVEKYYKARRALEIAGKQLTDEQRLSIG